MLLAPKIRVEEPFKASDSDRVTPRSPVEDVEEGLVAQPRPDSDIATALITASHMKPPGDATGQQSLRRAI